MLVYNKVTRVGGFVGIYGSFGRGGFIIVRCDYFVGYNKLLDGVF